jgi:hypothetical protein
MGVWGASTRAECCRYRTSCSSVPPRTVNAVRAGVPRLTGRGLSPCARFAQRSHLTLDDQRGPSAPQPHRTPGLTNGHGISRPGGWRFEHRAPPMRGVAESESVLVDGDPEQTPNLGTPEPGWSKGPNRTGSPSSSRRTGRSRTGQLSAPLNRWLGHSFNPSAERPTPPEPHKSSAFRCESGGDLAGPNPIGGWPDAQSARGPAARGPLR